MEQLNPRIRTVWLAVSVVAAVALAYVVGLAPTETAVQPPVPLSIVVFGVVLVVGVVYQYLRYKAWGFEIQDDAVYIEHGVVVRVKKVVPFVRVQHIDSRRGPVERASGLASLVIYTAGSRGADVSVPGLTPERADELRERLRELAIENEESIEDAV
jgi:membrane protein YdbS with pleckstrin-like domain